LKSDSGPNRSGGPESGRRKADALSASAFLRLGLLDRDASMRDGPAARRLMGPTIASLCEACGMVCYLRDAARAGKRYRSFTDLIPAWAALIHSFSVFSKGTLGDRATRGVPSRISSTWAELCPDYASMPIRNRAYKSDRDDL